VILFRCFPWDRRVAPGARGGALWFPRLLQGPGRHDNPSLYGCLYVSEAPMSPVVEQLARLRGSRLADGDLLRGGLPLAVAALELAEEAVLVDLDEPLVLAEEGLRPSLVATRERARTQGDAAALWERHPEAVGLRWWSAFESQWPNTTLFDSAGPSLEVADVRTLELGDEVLTEAARFLGLALAA
jgi:hypothetical protein